MRINEVEQLTGIAKKNIRFYEQEQLIKPQRNSQNGYREYQTEDVVMLQKIRLMRKLAVPLEEIRRIQQGQITLEDALRRHEILLARKRQNLQEIQEFCRQICQAEESIAGIDAESYLRQMEEMEQQGTRFESVQRKDCRQRYLGPCLAAASLIALFLLIAVVAVWNRIHGQIAWWEMSLLLLIACSSVGVTVFVLLQRLSEIRSGEEDDIEKY